MDDASKVRRIINTLVFGIFGFIVAIIFIRILLKLLGANPEAGFVVFWYQLSNNFVGSFQGIYPSLETTATRNVIEVYSLIAMMFYLILALLSAKLFTSVTQPTKLDIINTFIDGVFKFIEFFLITRFILKITGANVISLFVNFIYSVSAIIYEPFTGILPTYKVGTITFETSTLIAIIIIIIFDLVTENLVKNLRKDLAADKSVKQNLPASATPGTYTQAPSTQQPSPTNITINLPQPLQPANPPHVVERRTVQIFNPPQPQAKPHKYPGQYQNQLENQPPIPSQQLPQKNLPRGNIPFNPDAPAPRHPFN